MEPTHEEEAVASDRADPEPSHVDEVTPSSAPADVDRIMQSAGPALPGLSTLRPLRWAWSEAVELDTEVGQHRDVTVHIANDDAVRRELASIAVTGTTAFKVVGMKPTAIGPNGSARIVLRYAPSVAGVERGTLGVVADQGPGATMSLTGRARPKTEKSTSQPAPTVEPVREADAAATANRWKLAAPSEIDLGDNVVGKRANHEASIFALDRDQGPRVRATLQGDASMKLTAAPLFLPGTRQFDPSAAFRFEHRPTRAGETKGVLEVEIMDAPHETVRYPVRAAAHDPGDPTLAEQHEAKERQNAEDTRTANDAAESERKRGEVAAELEHDRHYHSGHLAKLGDKRDAVVRAFDSLYKKRAYGIASAEQEIGAFVRSKHSVKPSLVEQLAWLALDIATAGIAGGLAKRLETALSQTFTTPVPNFLHQDPRYPRVPSTSSPSKALVAIFTDGLKETVKKSTKLRSGPGSSGNSVKEQGPRGIGHTPDGDTYAMQSEDPKVQFFAVQQSQLATANETQPLETAQLAHNSLLPLLRKEPAKAIAMMDAVPKQIADGNEDAMERHCEESVRKWVRYVAETSAEGPNRDFDERRPLAAMDGLVDVRIKPNFRNPHAPVQVVGARINGVRRAVVTRLAKQPLLKAGLVVRAAGDFNSPSATLTTVRHGDGRVEYTENTSNGKWLERKAAAHGRGHDAEWGARLLLEKDIMAKPLFDHVSDIENDSDE